MRKHKRQMNLTVRMVLTSLLISVLLVLLSVRPHIVIAGSNGSISFGDIQSIIQIISPVDNASYTGDVSLNISVAFEAYSHMNSTVIPYQDITCIYRLDSSEWRNASFNSVSEPTIYWSWVNQIYTIQITCSYSATLQVSSSGLHSVSVDVNPDVIRSFDSRTYNDSIGVEYYYLNTTVNFYVSNSLEHSDSFPIVPSTASIAAVTIAIAIVGVAGLLVYFKKHKRQNSSSSAVTINKLTIREISILPVLRLVNLNL